jgi:hypothetical protein
MFAMFHKSQLLERANGTQLAESGIGQLAYDEQAVAFILTHAPVVSPKITLTSIDVIKFK